MLLAHPELPFDRTKTYYNPVKVSRDNYIKVKLLNVLDNPESKLCSTQFYL